MGWGFVSLVVCEIERTEVEDVLVSEKVGKGVVEMESVCWARIDRYDRDTG
jgi:hypothetical protein